MSGQEKSLEGITYSKGYFHKSSYVYYEENGPWYNPYSSIRRYPRSFLGAICCCCFIISLIIVLAVGPGTKTTDLNITALETVLINPDTTWYSHVEVETADFIQVVSYKFDAIPPLSDQTVEKNQRHALPLNGGQFQYWSYRFTTGASVVLSFSLTKSCEFLLFKGESTYSSWKSGGTFKTEKSLYTNQLTHWAYTVPSEDVYYFVWKNTNKDSVTGEAIFSITMLTYDISGFTEICLDNSDCVFELKRGSSQCVVVAGLDNLDGDDTYFVRYFTTPRRDYYWTIFGIFLAIFASIIIVTFSILFCIYHQQKTTPTKTNESTQSLMVDLPPQSGFQNS